jgi:plasmid stabilization system protein ParE
MKVYNINVLPAAREDIVEIYNYIELDSPDAAFKVTIDIADKLDALSEFPERCPLVQDGSLAVEGYRTLFIGNYIAFFKIFEDDVFVYRVLHVRRDYPRLL